MRLSLVLGIDSEVTVNFGGESVSFSNSVPVFEGSVIDLLISNVVIDSFLDLLGSSEDSLSVEFNSLAEESNISGKTSNLVVVGFGGNSEVFDGFFPSGGEISEFINADNVSSIVGGKSSVESNKICVEGLNDVFFDLDFVFEFTGQENELGNSFDFLGVKVFSRGGNDVLEEVNSLDSVVDEVISAPVVVLEVDFSEFTDFVVNVASTDLISGSLVNVEDFTEVVSTNVLLISNLVLEEDVDGGEHLEGVL